MDTCMQLLLAPQTGHVVEAQDPPAGETGHVVEAQDPPAGWNLFFFCMGRCFCLQHQYDGVSALHSLTLLAPSVCLPPFLPICPEDAGLPPPAPAPTPAAPPVAGLPTPPGPASATFDFTKPALCTPVGKQAGEDVGGAKGRGRAGEAL